MDGQPKPNRQHRKPHRFDTWLSRSLDAMFERGERAAEHRRLLALDDRALKDIGLGRGDAFRICTVGSSHSKDRGK